MGNLEAAENAYFGRENPKEETKQTNGDRIRSMTDEELAAFLMSAERTACTHCRYNTDHGCSTEIICTEDHTRSVWQEWLSSPADQAATEELSVHEKYK